MKANNLFVELAEEVARTLTVRNCFMCGGTNMGEQWPWEALEASPEIFNNMSLTGNISARTHFSGIVWTLSTNLVGKNCFGRNQTEPVGDLICLGVWDQVYKSWTSPGNKTEPIKFNITLLSYLNTTSEEWVAPNNMYWICGNLAYEKLPNNWSGSCVLGWIKPSFFFLPIQSRQMLGVPVYDLVGLQR